MSLSLTPEQTSDTVYALLKVGVPPTAVARALELDPDHVKGCLNHMRVERYGTDEISEAMTHLIWEAYEESLNQIRVGTPANKIKYLQFVLARSIGIAGKSSPETSEKIRQALDDMREGIAPVIQLAESIYEDE